MLTVPLSKDLDKICIANNHKIYLEKCTELAYFFINQLYEKDENWREIE